MNEDIPTTDTSEPEPYQPADIDQNALQQVEGTDTTPSVPTTVVTPEPAAPTPTPTPVLTSLSQPYNNVVVQLEQTTSSPKKLHRGLKITLIVIASLLVLLAAGFSVFYFAIRTPNSEYDAAIKNLQTMKAAGESVRDMKINGAPAPDYKNSKQYITANQYATRYVDALAKLQASPVMKKDMSVKLAYANNKSLIEPYGQSTLDMSTTIAVFQEVDVTCRKDLNKGVSYQTTKQIIDATFSDCSNELKAHPTVPTKLFNDGYYVKYVAAVKAIIDDAYAYAGALNTGDASDQLRAIEDIQMASLDFSHIGDGADNIGITNSAQPSTNIADVIKVVKQRKDVMFRW